MKWSLRSGKTAREAFCLNDPCSPLKRTIIFAGHETTARSVSFPNISTGNTSQLTLQLTFFLWELAKNRRVQEKLREEVTETLGQIKARGKSDFTVEDLDLMPYLVAIFKVCLAQFISWKSKPLITTLYRKC